MIELVALGAQRGCRGAAAVTDGGGAARGGAL